MKCIDGRFILCICGVVILIGRYFLVRFILMVAFHRLSTNTTV